MLFWFNVTKCIKDKLPKIQKGTAFAINSNVNSFVIFSCNCHKLLTGSIHSNLNVGVIV